MRSIPSWVKGGCLGAALVVGAVVFFYACTAAVQFSIHKSNFTEAQTRAKVLRVMSKSRTIQTALEQYKKDTGSFPPTGSAVSHLTTPIAYISYAPTDAFATAADDDEEKTLLSYYTTADHFLIWSVGPDKKSDIDPIADLPGAPQTIIIKTYDATNGTVSPGDIILTNVQLR